MRKGRAVLMGQHGTRRNGHCTCNKTKGALRKGMHRLQRYRSHSQNACAKVKTKMTHWTAAQQRSRIERKDFESLKVSECECCK